MAETKVRVPLTSEHLNILLGLLGPSEYEVALKLAATPAGPERTFYGDTLGKLNRLSRLLNDHHPRRNDTSQDAAEDEDENECGSDDDDA